VLLCSRGKTLEDVGAPPHLPKGSPKGVGRSVCPFNESGVTGMRPEAFRWISSTLPLYVSTLSTSHAQRSNAVAGRSDVGHNDSLSSRDRLGPLRHV